MRLKHVWGYVPLPAYAKTFWARVTFSRLTVTYLIFSIIHFFIQLALQSNAFAINADAYNAGSAFLEREAGKVKGLPIYINSTLLICKWVPSNLNLEDGECDTIWPATETDTTGQQADMSQMPTYYANSAPPVPVSLTGKPTLATPTILSISSATSLHSTTPSIDASQATQEKPTSAVPPVNSASPTPTSPVKGADISSSIVHITTTASVVSPTAAHSAGRNDDDNDGDDSDDDDSDNEVDGSDDGDEGTTENSDDDEPLGDVIAQLLHERAEAPTNATEIDTVCLKAWHYPLSILENTIREDIVFIAFQFWVLGMSVVALLNESSPHILASLITHVVATIWGSLQLVHTAHFRTLFGTLITEGACKTIQTPVTSHYWDSRQNVEAVSLAFNALAMFVSCFLSWRLFKLFGWQTFKRVGASRTVNRMYKLVLVLSITIQLSFFFVAVTVSLWLDRLLNNFIGDLVDLRKAYLASSIITLILLIPWLMMGWFGSRRELRIPMLVFLGLCIVYLGGWGIMFISTTFRWTFITWDLFTIMAVASVSLTFACLIFGVLCRINFDRGLRPHLSPQDEFSAARDFGIVTPDHSYGDEKIEFPSIEAPMPTFNAPYGYGASSQGRVFIGDGSSFYNQGSPPPLAVAIPSHALTRSSSYRSTDSFSSEESSSSWDNHSHSHHGSNSYNYTRTNRWIIE